VRAAEGKAAPWQDFLFWDPTGADQDFRSLPTSYLSHGMETVAMRSTWETDAVWAAFAAGPYVNNPDSGEEYFDEGTLAIVRGGRQLLVNAPAALQRNTPGTSDGSNVYDQIYADEYGSPGNRSLFNIFYVARPSPYGQGSIAPGKANTHIARFEDGGSYVAMRGLGLEQMWRAGGVVSRWTRDVVYLRPSMFVVTDRTSIANAGDDQWLAFHLAGQPTTGAGGRFDVMAHGGYAGTVYTLAPSNATTMVEDLFAKGKVYRLSVRPADGGTDQQWVTVFDAAADAGSATGATALRTAGGEMIGARLAGPSGNFVTLSSAGADAPVVGDLHFTIPTGATRLVIADLTPGGSYDAAVESSDGSGRTIHLGAGTALRASANGVLTFMVTATGANRP
jgi:hypothetical protein